MSDSPFEFRKPRILDLFCGAGGASMGYHLAGFEVIGVDVEPQPNYPFHFIRADVFDIFPGGKRSLLFPSFIDAIHASPPCQRWSSKTRHPEQHLDRITPLRPLLDASGLPYVIENVEGAPLRHPVRLCGSSFLLRVRRHRLFEANFPIAPLPCDHTWQNFWKPYLLYDHGTWFRSGIVHVFGTGGGKARDYWPEAMGCGDNWSACWMTPAELAEAIPPKYTEYVGHNLMQHLGVQHALAEGAA